VEVSVNWTVSGAVPEVGVAVKLTTGAATAAVVAVVTADVTVMVCVAGLVLLPPALPAVNETV